MSKTKKLSILTLLAVLILSVCCVFLTLQTKNARADVNTFAMQNGASVRIETTNTEYNGLRFTSYMDKASYNEISETATFGMLILPLDYFTTYATNFSAENNDFITALNKANAVYANVAPITGYSVNSEFIPTEEETEIAYYAFNGVMSNVRYDNLNRDFVGIGYYKLNDVYFYAYDSENIGQATRNFKQMVDAAIDAGACDDSAERLAIANEYVGLALCQENGLKEELAKTIDGKALYEGLGENQAVNFDHADYINLVNSGTDAVSIAEHNGESALKIESAANSYGYITINLLKQKVVTENTVILLKTHMETSNTSYKFAIRKKDGSVYFLIHGAAASNATNYPWVQLPSSDAYTKWGNNAIPAKDLGYEVGDVISSIIVDNTGSVATTIYIDSVYVFDSEFVGVRKNNNQNGNSRGIEYDGTSWNWFTTQTGVYEYAQLMLTNAHTVTENDYLVIEAATTTPSAHATRISTASATGVLADGDSTNSKWLFHQNGTDGFKLTTEFQKVYIPLSDLGYKAGDTITRLQLASWNLATTIKIKSITFEGWSTSTAYSYKEYKLAETHTVTENDYMVITAKSSTTNYRVRFAKTDGSVEKEFFHQNTSDGLATLTTEFQTYYVALTDLGYSVGDTISSVKFANWVDNMTFYINSISFDNTYTPA